jgi:uncharacterized protein (DUF983 family)
MMTEKKEKEKQKADPNRCSKCGSGQIYYRIKTREKVCRVCGNIEGAKQ